MPPEEQSNNQPPHGRQPFPRRSRLSIDGVMPNGGRPLMPSGRVAHRSVVPQQRPRQGVMNDVRRTGPPPLINPQPTVPAAQPAPDDVSPPGPPTLPTSAAPQPSTEPAPAPMPVSKPVPPAPEQTPQPPAPVVPTVPQTPTAPREFTPPSRQPRRWRKVLLLALIAIIVLGIGGGAWYWWHQQQIRNDPTNVFSDALTSSLATRQLQANTTAPSGNGSQVDYDFSSVTNPLVSSQSDVTLDGAQFQIEGYGSAQSTFISYAKFPTVIPSSITSVAQNAWVQLRSQGKEPATVSAVLSNLADPRYQDFGPLVFGNFPLAQRPRLVNFLLSQHIYDYKKSAVTRGTLGGHKVFIYPVLLNINFMQVFIQSAAVLEGFAPSDVQAAVNSLDNYKGDTVMLYVSASTHRFVRAVYTQNGQSTTVDYSGFNDATLLNEPETNLAWQDFAAVQQQIENQAATHASPAQLDVIRQADLSQLHLYLATYFTAHSFYPAYADLANPNWIATNMPGVDPDAFRDPLSATATLAPSPKKGAYSYQTSSPSGKTCSNDISAAVSELCTTYTLTATLSDGKPYTVTNP